MNNIYIKQTILVSDLIFTSDKYNMKPKLVERHKQSDFYKKIFDSIKKEGLKNPLFVIDKGKGNKYKIIIGNNRLMALKELEIKEVDVYIFENRPDPKEIRKLKKDLYKRTEVDKW